MFTNWKLSTKISFGFIVVLFIAVILGVLAIWNMNNVTHEANDLSQMRVPEVIVANNVERNALMVMYNMRAWGLTDDKKYYEEGSKYLTEVKKYLQEAIALTVKYPELTNLKKNAERATAGVTTYESLIEETGNNFLKMDEAKTKLDSSAKEYMDNCYLYLKSQENKLKEEIDQKLSAGKIKERFLKTELINNVIDLGNNIRIKNQKAIADNDAKAIRELFSNFIEIEKILSDLKNITTQQSNIEQLNIIIKFAQNYKNAMEEVALTFDNNTSISEKRAKAADEVTAAAKETAISGVQAAQDIANGAVSILNTSSLILIIGLIIAVIVGIILAFTIILSITRPVDKIVKTLTESSDQVTSASEQLSTASQQLAEGSSEQASAIEETSSTLSESASMVQQNTENTKQAAILAAKAKEFSEKGNQEMVEMSEAMNEIKKSSDEISKIIKVIDDIAFQTNILALNAAVEAARAGEAGMGFAVVAEEVRNLAQRSAQAAKDTASMIEKNIQLSQKGVEVMGRVGESLQNITLQAKKVNELMDEISVASQEQAQGITQINKAMTQMEQVVQSNASTAEESASASEELSAQAEALRDIVGNLAVLVYGSGGTVKSVSKKNKRASVTESVKYMPRPAVKSNKVIHSSSTKTVNPEEIIPLDDDSGDF